MGKLWILVFLCGLVHGAWAAPSSPAQKLHQPYFLQAKDKVPRSDLACPEVDLQGPDGLPLDLEINIMPPDPAVTALFCAPALFELIQRQKTPETTLQRFYWHGAEGFQYCHFKDMEGNQWYGWQDKDGKFSWILWRGHRYWWHDAFAGHWLYYNQGVWWRADGQAKNSIQADLDGEYYACDAAGNLMGDMGQSGDGDIVSAPGRYQGDSAPANGGGHGGHGGHGSHPGGGHGNHNGGQPSQASPQGGSPSSAPGISLSVPSSGN